MEILASDKNASAALHIHGDVLSVLEGRVDKGNIRLLDPSTFYFGLGSGTFSGPEHLGEAFGLAGHHYASWVEEGQMHTETKRGMKSAFFMGIERRQSCSELVYEGEGYTLQQFYEAQAKKFPQGFAVLAHARFSKLEATYLKTPPIYNENINTLASKYWAETEVQREKEALIFGVALPERALQKYPKELLDRAFYQNPKDKQTGLLSHTHAAVLKPGNRELPSKDFFSSLPRQPVAHIRHFLTQSVIGEGVFATFMIDRIHG